jgi:hypothetical protein
MTATQCGGKTYQTGHITQFVRQPAAAQAANAVRHLTANATPQGTPLVGPEDIWQVTPPPRFDLKSDLLRSCTVKVHVAQAGCSKFVGSEPASVVSEPLFTRFSGF